MNYMGYETNLNQSYLVLEPKEKDFLDTYQIRMLSENHLDGLLSCGIREKDGRARAYYNITSCEELKKRYENKEISFEECREILLSIQKILYQMQEYLLDGNRLCLNENFMFWDNSNNQLKLLFLPIDDLSLQDSFKRLAEYMLEKVDHRDDLAVSVAYHFYKDSRSDHFSLQSVIRVLNEAEVKKAEIIREEKKKIERQKKEESKNGNGLIVNYYQKGEESYDLQPIGNGVIMQGETTELSQSMVLPFQQDKREQTIKKERKQEKKKEKLLNEENNRDRKENLFLKQHKISILCVAFSLLLGIVSITCSLSDTARKGTLFGAVVLLVFGIYTEYKKKKQDELEENVDIVQIPNINQNRQQPVLFPKDPYQLYPNNEMEYGDEIGNESWNPAKAVM